MADAFYIQDDLTEKPSPIWLKEKMPFYGYTFKDFMAWDDGFRVELIEGIPFMMAPPVIRHQEIAGDLFTQIKDFLKDKPCKVFIAPIGVRLFPEKNDKDQVTVLPDIIVVCDKSKLEDQRAVKGAPDFIIEVLSPSTKGHDLITKKELYERAGVKEYWVVAPDKLYKYLLINTQYSEEIIEIKECLEVQVSTLPGCALAVMNEE